MTIKWYTLFQAILNLQWKVVKVTYQVSIMARSITDQILNQRKITLLSCPVR